MKNETVMASVVAFTASFCILVIELVAGRIMAPYIGVSLYSWTSIIGVVLAGISIGAYLGGLLADRYPHQSTLGWLLLSAGAAGFTIAPLTDLVGNSDFLDGVTTLMVRILALTTIVFFVPSLLLGMISPVVIKLAVKNLEKTGHIVGKISAFSTLGSILGTFSTGFFLIEAMGTRTILYSVGFILALSAPVFGGLFSQRQSGKRQAVVFMCPMLLAASLTLLWLRRDAVARPLILDQDCFFYKESDYYTLMLHDSEHPRRGTEDEQIPLRSLILDHLTHSYTDMENPYYMHYGYLKVCQELVAWRTTEDQERRLLFIGGGGYTLPRYMDEAYRRASIDVVEIDPWVTKAAERYLDVQNRRIHSINQDGRWFVRNCKTQYDFVFGDAFNDLSIPYHLTTREFDALVKNILAPDGLFVVLVIDNIQAGQFFPAYFSTLRSVFGERNVYVIIPDYTQIEDDNDLDLEQIGTISCLLVASPQPIDMQHFRECLKTRKAEGCEAVSRVVPAERANQYLAKRRGKTRVLTDDHVPVDNLIAPMFEERFGYQRH
ncbi:MAG: fused MFS/spermidine synthase [Verrucomicrobia bacterium]|nr:fused MFS/spermidine synthase [Verrucomicrobiota bacterium]